MAETAPDFPCSLVIAIPLPTHRLASSALRALQVDAELSPLVRRSFSLVSPDESRSDARNGLGGAQSSNANPAEEPASGDVPVEEKTVLRTEYQATTNRMLRVSVNGFLESMGVVLGIMQELDVDVLAAQHKLAQG
ncbi:MAG: hypothetical protein LQ345_003842 [Seirophora villosa]|nr:MAG: hypothetical protein LQ345_003842 [Seirophora villosa]